jgi:hypothetical protein
MIKKLQIVSLAVLVIVLSSCAATKKGCNTCPDLDKRGKKYPKAKKKKKISVSFESPYLFA